MKGERLVRAGALALIALASALAHATHNTNAINTFNAPGGCTDCHSVGTTQHNGAGDNRLQNLNNIFLVMNCPYANGLTATERDEIATWLRDRVNGGNHTASLLINTTTPINTPHTNIQVGTHVTLGTLSFDYVETVSVSSGTLSFPPGSTVGTYSPLNATFVGDVTFSYRGRGSRVNPNPPNNPINMTGYTWTGTIRVGSTPTVTSSGTASGTVGSNFSYTIVANNAPTSYGHSGTLPAGTSRSGAVISGVATTATSYSPFVFASNALGTGTSKQVNITIGAGTPVVVTFPVQPSQTFVAGGTFSISNPATLSPALAETQLNARYVSQTPAVCTTPGTTSTTVTMVSAGTCTIRANVAASPPNWNASSNFLDRSITINPGTKTITFAAQSPASRTWSNGGSFAINPVATILPATETITYGTSTPTVCSVAAPNVSILRAGLCTITANSAANSNYNAAAQKTSSVTLNAAQPSAPTIGVATPADTQASIAFTPLTTANDGGAAIDHYTATCNPGAISSSGAGSPIVVGGLTNGQLYSCSVTATQVAPHSLTSSASATVDVTPAVYPAITSANNVTFTVLEPATPFNVTATGSPAPTLILSSGTLPSGITFNGPGLSPRTLSGTPASGTVGAYPLVFTADGSDPDATQNFTLTIAKRNQTVNFVDPADTTFGSGDVALVSNPSSGLGVSYASLTPTICEITGGTNATLLDVGDCEIEATAAGNGDWNAATQTQTFTIAKGDQTITFDPQVTASRPVNPNQTFTLVPVATVNSPLTVTYTTTNATICTASGTTITMKNAGVCGIVAQQAGDTQWNAAVDVTQNVTLTVASQTITFGPQVPLTQNYSPGGTFPINPLATASSGLSTSYFSDTPSICTVSGTTVTIVTIGECSIRAEQGGDGNFTAAVPVSQVVQINPVVPGAPTIGTADPGNQHAKVSFTPPSIDGGTPITNYRATCDGITGTGTTSPITVTGLTNGQAYNCTVAAQNAVGFGPESASTGVMPNLQGASLWTTHCQSCHGSTPAGARFNAAGGGLGTAVLDYVIATNPQMNIASLNALNPLERLDLKQYITSYLLASAFGETTVPDLPGGKVVNLGQHLTLNTAFPNPPGADLPGSFTHVVIDVQPMNGTLTPLGGVEFLYTPNPGFSGIDTFQYHGQRDSPASVVGDTFTFTINVAAGAPVLSVARNGTGTGVVFTDLPTSGIDCGADCTEAYSSNTQVNLIAIADPGSTFIGWSGACTGPSVVCNVTMDAAKAVTATFNLTPLDLTVSRDGAGTGTVTSDPAGISCGSTCTAGFAPGSLVALTPTADPGSAFTGWSGACSGTGACVVTVDAAKSVTATFQPTYLLTLSKSGLGAGTVTSSPAGIDCGSTCSAPYVTGTSVSLTPAAAVGSAFTGWSGDCTGMGACTVSMTAARTVTANFTPTYTLTVAKIGNGNGSVSSNPAGINACTGTCTADYLDSTLVDLTPTIGPDTDFLGWGGECFGTGACSVTMSAARSVTANFKSSIALTVTHAGTGSGIVTSDPEGVGVACGTGCTVGFDPGTIVTLGRSPAGGSVFAGWSGACTGTGACVLTMSQSRSVTATFNTAGGPQTDLGIASHVSNPPASASVGQQVTFTLIVANNGPAPATGVVLSDTIPTGATFVSASAGCTHSSGVVTCAIGSLASGASVQVEIVVAPTAAGGATNFATVTGAESDPLTFNNASALAVSVSAAANLGRLTNISTRGQVLTGDNVMIGGFIIGGASPKTVIVRARGPSLTQHGVPGVLANPQLQLYSGQTPIASNDNWGDAPNVAAISSSGFAPTDPNEAAILTTLAPGAYTAIVTGVGSGTGIAIVEVFEVDAFEIPLANISTRGRVGTGDNVLIGGFIIQGDGPQSVVIRARGPSLAQFGVQGVLGNPHLQLFTGQTPIAANDNWGDASNAADITASGFAPTHALESALLVTLQPGAYTVIVTGTGGGQGIGIVEVFRN